MEAAVNQLSAGTKLFSHLQLVFRVMFQLTLVFWKVGATTFTKNVFKIFAFIDILDQIEIQFASLNV